MPKRRRILKAEITHISLCPRGKNGFRTLYKEDDLGSSARFEFIDVLTKASDDFDEEGILYACVWAPELPDIDGDVASADVLEKMAHQYLRDHRNVDIRHDEKALPSSRAYVAESFIIQKGDPRFSGMTYGGDVVDLTGGWGIALKLEDEALRKAYRDGDWDGVSMFGKALFRPEEQVSKSADSGALDRVFGLLRDLIPGSRSNGQEVDMKKEDVEKLVQDTVKESTGTAVKELLIEAGLLKKEEPKGKETDPKGLDFDAADPAAVKKHLDRLHRETLAKDVDWQDAESVAAYHEALTKHLAGGERKKVEKSNQRSEDPSPPEDQIKKEVDAGLSIAEHINRSRGHTAKQGA